MSNQEFQSGDVIYSVDTPSDSAYLVQEGQVEITQKSGKTQFLGVGALFGELDMVKNTPRTETARAIVPSMVRIYKIPDFERMIAHAPSELQQLVVHLADFVAENKAPPATASKAEPVNKMMEAFCGGMERMTRLLEERCNALEQRVSAPTVQKPDEIVEDKRRALSEVLTDDLIRELSNLGPIMPLMEDDSINDVLINGFGQIYVEKKGKLELTDITFPNDMEVFKIAEKIVRNIGRKIDKRRPLIDARLRDGSRVNIIAPPLAVDGTSISIRKFAKKKITLDVMREQTNVSPQLAEFLRICGRVRLNIVISGGTGSGKTTLLNAVSQAIDHDERIVTIEDAAELQLQQPHVVRLETRPMAPGTSDREEVTMRDLVKNALRMRPDRIIVGEVRGPEAFDMMQAMNTGHEGSLTTIHANHPRDALSRMENMVSMANLNIPFTSIRYQIASAINLIIQISRMRDGHRRITHVSEIVGMEGDIITMQDLFIYAIEGEDEQGNLRGAFRWTGIMPRFLRRVMYYGEGEAMSHALGVKLPK